MNPLLAQLSFAVSDIIVMKYMFKEHQDGVGVQDEV